MPGWIQALIAIAAFCTALGVIWRAAIRPGAKIITQAEATIPMLAKLTKEWSDTPNLPAMVKDIYDQFSTNSGSSLKDAMNRLEAAAAENKQAAAENKKAAVDLNMQMEVNRALADNDRRIMDRLVAVVNVLDARMVIGVQGIGDIKTEQQDVAAGLVTAQESVDGVADDLLRQHKRANDPKHQKPGEAADAAARSEEERT